MNLYAIKDTLIDYFMNPFCAPDNKAVLAAIANVINSENNQDAISLSPKDFEIWLVATIDQEGNITPEKRRIATCDSLIRGNLRHNAPANNNQGDQQTTGTTRTGETDPRRASTGSAQ